MGRRRTINKHLPRRMVAKHGAYYHVIKTGAGAKWTHLGRDYGIALQRWAQVEGAQVGNARTVTDLLAAYIASARPRLAASTISGYESSLVRLSKTFGRMKPQDLRREHIYRYLVESGRVAANRDRALLGAAYSHAINLGLRCQNPAHGLQHRVEERPRDRYVTHAELEAVVGVARAQKRHTLALILRFAALTGADQGVICGLLVTAATDEGIVLRRNKTGRAVLVQWSDELRAVWREAVGARIGAQPVFRQRSGRAYTTDGLRAVWRVVRGKAGLVGVQFRDLRRKAGSDADSTEHAAALLAHADAKVTRRHYRARLVAVKPAG